MMQACNAHGLYCIPLYDTLGSPSLAKTYFFGDSTIPSLSSVLTVWFWTQALVQWSSLFLTQRLQLLLWRRRKSLRYLHLRHVFISVFSEKKSIFLYFFYSYSVKLTSFFLFHCQLFKTCPNSTKYMKSESYLSNDLPFYLICLCW